jgi:hypothetical protein
LTSFRLAWCDDENGGQDGFDGLRELVEQLYEKRGEKHYHQSHANPETSRASSKRSFIVFTRAIINRIKEFLEETWGSGKPLI